jgi:nickel-type superoxide dismutase maturation protease
MAPSLEPGDRLRVDPDAFRHRLPRVGEIVVLADPEARVPWLVKRVVAVDAGAGTVDVRGDNAEAARDSRTFGPVAVRAIVGRATRRYYPVGRAGDL